MNHPASPKPLSNELIQAARSQFLQAQIDPIVSLEQASGLPARQILQQLAQRFGLPVLDVQEFNHAEPAFDLLPLNKCLQRSVVLLWVNRADAQQSTQAPAARELCAVLSNPFDLDLQTWLQAHATGQASHVCLALAADIRAYLERRELDTRAMDTLFANGKQQTSVTQQTTEISFANLNDEPSPAVKLVNSTLYDAFKSAASDIHFESTQSGMHIKYRIDGVLTQASVIQDREICEQAISRLKVLAELDISERRIPQDGSFRVHSSGRDIDLRLSIMPSIHGEDAVIRVLDKRAMVESYGSLSLRALGLDTQALNTLRGLAEAAHGMLLVTGPTGSGKTTTLYAVISETNNGRDKIITIEDPVEYQLPGVLQIPVNDKKGLSFARGLRSILRHDPDKIMVGEIRDAETAEIAVQSALTGHLVLTTVHANNVFDVFGRFTHMGIDPYAFVSALNGIWAQRLIRLNCPHCAQPVTPDADELARMGLTEKNSAHYTFKAGTGCGDCRGTGYKGRRAIAEILVLNDELRELIIAKAPLRKIKEVARAQGTHSMRSAGLLLVARGETTLEEVRRVTVEE